LYILIYKILPKYIYLCADKYITMQTEAYFDLGLIEAAGELGQWNLADDPLEPPRRLIKRPLVAS
jgi:hypothetical protein